MAGTFTVKKNKSHLSGQLHHATQRTSREGFSYEGESLETHPLSVWAPPAGREGARARCSEKSTNQDTPTPLVSIRVSGVGCPSGFRGIPPGGAARPVVGLDALGRARRGPRLERSASHPSGAFRGGAPNVASGRGAGAARGSPHPPPPGVRGGRSLVGLAKRTGPVPALRR